MEITKMLIILLLIYSKEQEKHTYCIVFSPAGRAADLKSNGTIKISGPIKPEIDTHNGISVICFEFWCGGKRWVTFAGWQSGGHTF